MTGKIKLVRLCDVEGCGQKHYGRGKCQKHYAKIPEVSAAQLRNCHKYLKSEKGSAAYQKYISDPNTKANKREYMEQYSYPDAKVRAEYMQEYQKKQVNKESLYYNHIKYNYKLSPEQLRDMHATQKGLCKICSDPPDEGKKLHIDHCHVTGKVRGLLCNRCNTGLGLFRDREDYLISAAKYLQQTKENAIKDDLQS